MKITLISPDKKQYKANLHGHSTLSDGKLAPEALRDAYKAHGYSILAITDHERPHCHKALTQPDFIMLTGYECYIRPDQQSRFDPYGREVHLNLFARDPENTTMICFNAPYLKYVQRDNAFGEITARAGSERPREFTRDYINEYIRTARESGYLVAYNHPYWSMEDEADLLAYEGLFSLEICNYNSYVLNGLEHNGALYDKLLQSGRHIFCHGADDNHNDFPFDHPMNDAFGGFTMIMPEAFTYGSIIDAMEQNTATGAVNDITGQNDGLADTGDVVEVLHHKLTDGSGVDATVVNLHIGNFLHLLGITDTAPDDAAAGLGAGLDSGGQVAAQEGALVDLVVHIHNNNVALFQGVDDPLVKVALVADLTAHIEHNVQQVGTGGNIGGGNGAADQLSAVIVERLQIAFELALIALYENGLPQLFQSHILHSVQVLLRNLGTAVGETLTLPQRGHVDNCLSVVDFHSKALLLF